MTAFSARLEHTLREPLTETTSAQPFQVAGPVVAATPGIVAGAAVVTSAVAAFAVEETVGG
jgi:hypothetical protein